MAPIKELGGGGEEGRKRCFLPSLPSPPTFIFLALVSFLARPKPRIPFLRLSLLRSQTETLATQASQYEKNLTPLFEPRAPAHVQIVSS